MYSSLGKPLPLALSIPWLLVVPCVGVDFVGMGFPSSMLTCLLVLFLFCSCLGSNAGETSWVSHLMFLGDGILIASPLSVSYSLYTPSSTMIPDHWCGGCVVDTAFGPGMVSWNGHYCKELCFVMDECTYLGVWEQTLRTQLGIDWLALGGWLHFPYWPLKMAPERNGFLVLSCRPSTVDTRFTRWPCLFLILGCCTAWFDFVFI